MAILALMRAVSWASIDGRTCARDPGKYEVLDQASVGALRAGEVVPALGLETPVHMFGGDRLGASMRLEVLLIHGASAHLLGLDMVRSQLNHQTAWSTRKDSQGQPKSITAARGGNAHWLTDKQHFGLFGGLDYDVKGTLRHLN